MSNNSFLDIEYAEDGLSSTLIYIPKTHLYYLEIDGLVYRDSELNFMFIEGLNPRNESSSSISLNGMQVENLTFERSSEIFSIGSFFSEMKISIRLSDS